MKKWTSKALISGRWFSNAKLQGRKSKCQSNVITKIDERKRNLLLYILTEKDKK